MASLPIRRTGRNQTLMNPTREFEDIYDRMGQLMNFTFGGLTPVALAGMPWAPLGDVSETDDAYIARVELPGVNKDQVDVQLQGGELVITGEIPEDSGQEGGRRHRSTRHSGRFEFRAYLPGDVNPEGVTAQLSDGVLTVTVPKSEAAKPRKIEITG